MVQESRLRHACLQGTNSPEIIMLVNSLDAFVDHEDAFQRYLHDQEVEDTANTLGLRLRVWHRIHPKVCVTLELLKLILIQ